MEQDKKVLLKLDIGEDLHRALADHCERTGETVEQAISKILEQHLATTEDLYEKQAVPLDSLEWTELVPVARTIKMGMMFSLYDLVIRLHSRNQFSSLKVPGYWHSVFAQWVRRHEEFRIIPAQNGNLFQRISDVEAPLPKGRANKKPRDPLALRRMTQQQLQDAVRQMAKEWPMGETFSVDMLLGRVPHKQKPVTLGYGFYSKFNTWAKDTEHFSCTDFNSPRSHQFTRTKDFALEQTGEQPK